jgi:hypothetical protein
MAERPFYVENIVGDSRTRMHRANATQTQRNKLFIGGQRVLPRTKIPVTAEAFKRLAPQLMQMVLDGKIILTTPDRMRITSRWTGEFILTRADGAVKLLPRGEIPGCFANMPVPAPVPEPVVRLPDPEPEPEPEPVPEPAPAPEPEVMTSVEPAEVVEEPKSKKKRR